MATDDLSYGEGHFNFSFKDGRKLKLMSDGHFERTDEVQLQQDCAASSSSQPSVTIAAPKQIFADSAEMHILTLALGVVATTKVVMKGLLSLRQERNRSIEARQINRASGLASSAEEHQRLIK